MMSKYTKAGAITIESEEGIMFWVGILLIVSAGSFIYIATLHILPEVLHDKDHHGHHHSNTDEPRHDSKGFELFAMVIGLIAPLGLTYLED